jgi:hypothetical protein
MRATLLMWKKMPMSVSWNIPQADRMLQHSDSFGPHTAILAALNKSQIAYKKQLQFSNIKAVFRIRKYFAYRIRIPLWILQSSSKNSTKNLYVYCVVTS